MLWPNHCTKVVNSYTIQTAYNKAEKNVKNFPYAAHIVITCFFAVCFDVEEILNSSINPILWFSRARIIWVLYCIKLFSQCFNSYLKLLQSQCLFVFYLFICNLSKRYYICFSFLFSRNTDNKTTIEKKIDSNLCLFFKKCLQKNFRFQTISFLFLPRTCMVFSNGKLFKCIEWMHEMH